jgi:hypothetical protein
MARAKRREVSHARRLSSGLVAIAMLLSCSGKTKQAGGLELILETDVPTPATFDTVNMKLEQQAAGAGWHLLEQRDYVIPSEMTLPTSIAIVAGGGPYQDVLITVTGLAGSPPQPLVQRIVQTQVPTDRVDETLIVLSSKCLGKLTCPVAGDSCQPDMGTCGPTIASVLRPFSADDLNDAGVASTVIGVDGGRPPDANGGDARLCPVDAACGTAGAAGAVCADGSTIAACAQDAQGCYYTSSSSPCTNGACFGSAGSAQCCTNACTANATQCGGAGLQTCQVQGNGCTAWNAGAACGTHQHCTGSAGSSACTCNTDPNCSSTATVCANPTTSASCTQDAQGCYYTSSTAPCGANGMCQGGTCSCSSGYTPCGTSCVNVNTDNNNCGTCNHVCPVSASPSSATTCTGTCQISLGGYVKAGGNPIALDSADGTSYWVQARTPNAAGTFVGVGATVGSNDASGTTPFILGLYSDSAGSPGTVLFYTDYSSPAMAIANPSAPVALTSQSAGGSYVNGFTGALTANTAYWVYVHAGTGSSANPIAAPSTSPCVAGGWINVAPPGMGSYVTAAACPGDLDAYLIATFP